ncbi:uncharacterized protein SOCE836_019710 [Sorangium cellulosum]|uniref:Uncharacterized protein n=1 Tax=Sorangium cellulosum TaxID=56 RepID=A0A4P2QJJ3_SORCE|nr:uncharacterized protein SOCE836_019710 [Sorangium cellulosum]WCQ89266.1 hypothetical protein NQZ70_01953 [Sorangium sp. Soce836]
MTCACFAHFAPEALRSPSDEALHGAFVAAAEQRPRDGLPHHPRAWLVGAGRLSALAQRSTGVEDPC